MKPAPARLWLRIDLADGGQIGPGKIALLEAVDAHASISGAARALGMSYRRAWQLIDALNGLAAAPLVETHIGGRSRGGATLTEAGRRLIAAYRDLSTSADRAGRQALREISSLTGAAE